jgi:hypothetical protein
MNNTPVEKINIALQDAGFEPRVENLHGNVIAFFAKGTTASLTLERGCISLFRRDGDMDVLAGEFGGVNDANIKAAIREFKFHSAV